MFLSSILVIHSILGLSTSVIINTDYGLIEGSQYQSINRFIEVPYAKPPVNELRFAPPQPVEPWNGTLKATNTYTRVSCAQYWAYAQIRSEDCLFLNIFTPLDAEEGITNYAVLLWIHGGRFQNGYAGYNNPLSIMDYIGDIIIVSINYRLGILGSLYDNAYGTGLEGNYGYLDQKMAIQWVYENIPYFGGDQARIVLFGLSAGAYYVGLHLLYNNEYIAGGIMQSPPFGVPLRDPTTWYEVPRVFSSRVGCDQYSDDATALLNCWRSVSWQSIVDLESDSLTNFDFFADWNFFMVFTPTVQTNLLPNQLIFEWKNATLADQIPPFIIGHTRDEGFSFMSALQDFDYNLLYSIFEMFFGDSNVLDEILDHYEITSNSENVYGVMSGLFGDFAFDCAIRNITQNSMSNNVYYYQFNVIDTSSYSLCYNKSCHGDELNYLFDFDYDTNETSIGDVLKLYWTNFAKYLNPNDEAIGNAWDRFCMNMETMTIMNDNYTASSARIKEKYNTKCDFWDHIGYSGVYCTDCDYVPSDDLLSNIPIQECSDDKIELETTDIDIEMTATESADSTNKNTTNNLSTPIIVLIIAGSVVIVGVLLVLLVHMKRKQPVEVHQDQVNTIESVS
eukprot:1121679_1